MFVFFQLIAVVLVVLLSGCGSGKDGGLAIKGNVTYAGQPIKQGSITFRPTDSSKPDVSAAIVDGLYEIPAQLGPQPEEYTVKVVAFRMKKDPRAAYTPSYLKDSAANDANAGTVPEQYIPKKHNDDSKLKVTFNAAQPSYDFNLDK